MYIVYLIQYTLFTLFQSDRIGISFETLCTLFVNMSEPPRKKAKQSLRAFFAAPATSGSVPPR